MNGTKIPLRSEKEDGKVEKDKEEKQDILETLSEQWHQTIFGVRFPWEVYFFVAVGFASEAVDSIFMHGTLETLSGDLSEVAAWIIAGIVGAGCFFSMAFVGFQLGNRRYYTKFGEWISYGFWATAGLALVTAKLLAGLVDGGILMGIADGSMGLKDAVGSEEFISQAIVAMVQLFLYIGTGFMTRDSVKILTDNDLREYFAAKRRYEELLEELSEKRKALLEDISHLGAYERRARRLIKSKAATKKNIAQYNEAARALIEARMSISVEPDLMEGMYDEAMKKEGRSKTL